MKWLLMIWYITCGWADCDKKDYQEILIESKEDCEYALESWIKANSHHQGACIPAPVQTGHDL